MEKIRGVSLCAISVYPKGLEQAQFKNCENMIGAIQVPLGVAGPLAVCGSQVKGDYYIPLATSEGALVASVNRGCKAITSSGGAKVYTQSSGMTRGSLFKTNNLRESMALAKWFEENFALLNETSRKTSSHLTLLKIFSKVVGKSVFVRFSFDTKDAMGMNMVTIAADSVTKLVEDKTGAKCIALAGNFDTDKKPSWLNFILGRGRQVWAEGIIKKQIIKEVLKTTPENIHRVAVEKCLVGSAVSGSLGFNAHFANVIAALFLACGQDIAHVTEGSLGITSTEITEEGLYISVYLPDLAVGTVGGGTALPSQKEALDILKVSGGKNGMNAAALAEITGAAVLAGELSLLSSLAEGSLASAHASLGRGSKSLR